MDESARKKVAAATVKLPRKGQGVIVEGGFILTAAKPGKKKKGKGA